MPRGGLSADPAKRAAQLARLAEGRAEAARRRAEGLPTKRTEQARTSGTGKVAAGRYRETPPPAAKPARSSSSAKPKQKTTTTRRPSSDGTREEKQPGKLVRAYARILGYA